MSLVRMWFIALYMCLTFQKADLVIVDQITLPIPLLRLFGYKVLYYCHFPEALLNDNKPSPLGNLYRFVMDTLEVCCLHFASMICYNSRYTRENVEIIFPSMKTWKGKQQVVYPCVLNPPAEIPTLKDSALSSTLESTPFMLTINRFETRKRLDLSLTAFAEALKLKKSFAEKPMNLVIAGGLNKNSPDCLKCREELSKQAEELGISKYVIFRENISQEEKEVLLRRAYLFLYTPPNEHFGIGPIEAMIRGVPTIAINHGGPIETVIDEETGFLLPTDPKKWAEKTELLVD